MALPLAIPSSPAGAGSPSSTDGSNGPRTPSSPSPPTLALSSSVDGAGPAAPGPVSSPTTSPTSGPTNNVNNKRKPSRRANTAERRATHNAVERQRRETLNSRFLDLAALLPNLSQIRRPSKSSIVNSSIAHIHASRRHRLVAARELRLLKLETDALRRELNEWRDRSGLPRVEEPVRGEAFQMILNGEVEVLSAGLIEEEDGNGDYAGDDYGEDDFVGAPANPGSLGTSHVSVGAEDAAVEEMHGPIAHAAAAALLKNSSDVNPFAHTVPTGGLHLQTMISRQGAHPTSAPMIVQSPTAVSFENPAVASMYEPHHSHASMGSGQYPGQFYGSHGNVMGNGEDKASWGGAMYPLPSGQQQFTPPTSSQGNAQHQAAYYMNMQRQQAMMQQHQRGPGHIYGSPTDGDDASSVGSASGTGMRRERSGSMGSTGSGYGSSGAGGNYEMSNAMPRRIPQTNGAHFGDNMGMNMGGMNMGVGMMKGQPITVGGGGNGHGYASMML